MTIELTDAQIVRVFELCNIVAKIQKEVPAPPVGTGIAATADLETAKNLRTRLQQQNDVLVELGALLR